METDNNRLYSYDVTSQGASGKLLFCISKSRVLLHLLSPPLRYKESLQINQFAGCPLICSCVRSTVRVISEKNVDFYLFRGTIPKVTTGYLVVYPILNLISFGGCNMAYKISDACISCGSCENECPVEAISAGDSQYLINADVCIDCGACAGSCPVDAIAAD